MQVAVVGAGIIGVTTAYEMATMGHEVTVWDSGSSVATEASFANAGVLAPGYVTPWAAPGMPMKALRHLFRRHAPVRLAGLSVATQLPWMWRWWRACQPAVHSANRAVMQRLAHYSRERLLELTRTLRLDYDQNPGYLVLLRTQHDLALAEAGLKLMRDWGVHFELIDAAGCHHHEPGLNFDTPLHAGVHLPYDGVGNCRHFAHLLKSEAQQLGATFRFDSLVHRIVPGTRPEVLVADGQHSACDAVIVCAGVQANALLAPLGCRLPLAPVYGYSVTAPVRQVDGLPQPGPRAAVMDETYKVAITRLGQRVRVAGGAELGGRIDRINAAPIATLYRVLDDWFPGAALTRDAQHWKGARPMLPDGPPVLGASGATGVWLNLGHGSSGWTLACGSARVLAEVISGREPPLDVALLGRHRLR
jgi:D-amino-acid dehydrogenase